MRKMTRNAARKIPIKYCENTFAISLNDAKYLIKKRKRKKMAIIRANQKLLDKLISKDANKPVARSTYHFVHCKNAFNFFFSNNMKRR